MGGAGRCSVPAAVRLPLTASTITSPLVTWRLTPFSKELVYDVGFGPKVSVSVSTRPTFTFGNPAPVPIRSGDRISSSERNIDIMRDGKQFLGVVAAGQSAASGAAAAPQMQVVLNWFEELKTRVPVK